MTKQTNRVRNRLEQLEENAREGRMFVDNILFVTSRLEAADNHDESDIDVTSGSGLSFVEITVTAWFESLEDVPMDVVDDREWDSCSIGQADGKARVYLEDRKDLRA